MEVKKKPTNAQLQRRIERAVLHIDKTRETKEVFFSDKGLRLTVTEEYAVIETGYHRHVFDAYNLAQGVSRPYMYVSRLVDIALENDCKTEDGYSFQHLLEVLLVEEKRPQYNIAKYMEWYLFNIFAPLYTIGEHDAASFLVFEDYVHNLARQTAILEEKKEDVTNKQFVNQVCDTMKECFDDVDEYVVFEKKTDEEVMRENLEAEEERIMNETMEIEESNADGK